MVPYVGKTLVIVRHGETEWNGIAKAVRLRQMEVPEKLRVPNYCTELSDIGRAQAVATGKKLKELFGEFRGIYCSPWIRAKETMELIVEQFGSDWMKQSIRTSPLLVEQNPGEIDAGIIDPDTCHETYQRYRSLGMKHGFFYLQMASVESWAQVALRVRLFLESKELSGREPLLLVTHGITTMLLRFHLERLTETQVEDINRTDHPKNCGVYEYQHNGLYGYQLKRCNETFY